MSYETGLNPAQQESFLSGDTQVRGTESIKENN
jgi:hypothetical protein